MSRNAVCASWAPCRSSRIASSASVSVPVGTRHHRRTGTELLAICTDRWSQPDCTPVGPMQSQCPDLAHPTRACLALSLKTMAPTHIISVSRVGCDCQAAFWSNLSFTYWIVCVALILCSAPSWLNWSNFSVKIIGSFMSSHECCENIMTHHSGESVSFR
jgi:hypothetical protein